MRVIPGASCAAALLVSSSAVSGSGRLIAVDSSRALYELDPTNGARTLIATVSSNAGTTGGLAYDRASSTMYLTSTSNDALYTLNVSTGAATLVGAYGADPDILVHGIEYDDSTGALYAGSRGNFYAVNKTTGALSLIGATGMTTTSFNNFGYDIDSNTMYMINTNTDSLYTIDRATGVPTLVGAMTGTSNPHGLAYDSDNSRMYLIDSSTDILYALDLATGAPTVIGSVGSSNLLGLAYIPEIPEPASIGSFCVLAALGLRRRAG